MFGKFLITGALLLAFSTAAQAGPFRFIKRQFTEHPLRTQLLFAGVASGVSTWGLHECRLPNVENCQGHYGAAWADQGLNVGMDFLGVFMGHKIGGRTGQAISYGSSTALLGWGAYQWHGGLNKPSEDAHEPDLVKVIVLKRP